MKTNITSEYFQSLLNEDNANTIAKFLSENLGEGDLNSDPPQLLDFDFKLQKGVFLSGNVNTWFKIDAPKGSVADKIIEVLSNDKFEPSPDDVVKFTTFLSLVSNLLETSFSEDIKNKIRINMLRNVSKEVMPLKEIRVVNFELNDLPSKDWVLSVEKMVGVNSLTQSVAYEIMDQIDITKETPEQFIARKKKEGDPKYENVKNAYKKKYWFNMELDLWVDYSLAST